MIQCCSLVAVCPIKQNEITISMAPKSPVFSRMFGCPRSEIPKIIAPSALENCVIPKPEVIKNS